MSYAATVIEVFLSSPTDVGSERGFIVAYAGEWNRLRSRDTGCFISILTLEEMVAPALGTRSQQVVNDQIGSSYDVYLGVMWTRLGTPTGVADSGTVEEYDRALERAKLGDGLRIAALFKTAPIDPEAIDPTQLQKVREFKKRISGEGAFYREFSDEDSLRSILSLLFEQIARERRPAVQDSPTAPAERKARNEHESERLEELGLIEVGEEFTRLVGILLERLREIADEESRNNQTITACTEQTAAIIQLGSVDADGAKAVVHSAASSLRRLADYYDKAVDPLDEIFRSMSELVEQDIRIRLEFDDPLAVAGENIESIRGLTETIGFAIDQLGDLIKATSSLPRLSSELAKAKARLGRSREKLQQMFISVKQSLESSISFFEESVVHR